MESSPTSETGPEPEPFDSARPFRDVVVCCTSIPPDQRTDIATRTADMGGVHKYDLTLDVTHLIVGDYDTPKYRHVAKERPDIKPMAAGWVEAVLNLWKEDHNVDFAKLESEWTLKAFETARGSDADGPERGGSSLLCCLTGFQDSDQRQYIEDKVTENGGAYTGDLSKKVTHLIVHQPEGKKYLAAKGWGVKTVSIEWLQDSVERGMILDEELYDPVLPKEERGKGAWVRGGAAKRVSLGKRARDGGGPGPNGDGRRKLRKTASLKMLKQGNSLWGDILENQAPAQAARAGLERAVTMPAAPVAGPVAAAKDFASQASSAMTSGSQAARLHASAGVGQAKSSVFSDCRFFVHGFTRVRSEVVREYLTGNGGRVDDSIADVALPTHDEPLHQRFLVVPVESQPDTHPLLPDGVRIVTQFYIERCLLNKQLIDPDDHVLNRPFPRFPVDGFETLTICSGGIVDVQLQQLEKAVKLLGATYSEFFNKKSSLLLCSAPQNLRKDKAALAALHKIPVVDPEWLWQCIETGFRVPWDRYVYRGADRQAFSSIDVDPALESERQKLLHRTRSEPAMKKRTSDFRAPSFNAGVDHTAFDVDQQPVATKRAEADDDAAGQHGSYYETAATHLSAGPLTEVSRDALNKTSSSSSSALPPKPAPVPAPPTQKTARNPFQRFPSKGTVVDSEEGGDDEESGPETVAMAAAAREAEKEVVEKEAEKEEAGNEAEKEKEEEATRQRRRDEEKSAEREVLSRRLRSIISIDGTTAATAQEGSGSGGVGGSGSGSGSDHHPHPQRRKREVMGRAISNVSAASSASAESSAAAGGGGQGATTTTAAEEGEGGKYDDDDDGDRPSGTQIEYDNPEARMHRQAVIARFQGQGRGVEKAREMVRERERDKVTLEGLRRDVDICSGAAVRKSRRR